MIKIFTFTDGSEAIGEIIAETLTAYVVKNLRVIQIHFNGQQPSLTFLPPSLLMDESKKEITINITSLKWLPIESSSAVTSMYTEEVTGIVVPPSVDKKIII